MIINRTIPLLLSVLPLVAGGALAQQKKAAGAAQTHETVFLYNPDAKGGMCIACCSAGDFKEQGQLFSSDYSRWGSEKKMYSPFVTALPTGGYAAVFQVNDYSPCFAVAYSDDLITWRPQDYPHMSVNGCIAPVIRNDGNGRYSVLFRTKQGGVRQTATDASFRHFSADREASEADYLRICAMLDTANVGGKTMTGNILAVETSRVDSLKAFFAKQANDQKLAAESLADDGKRFGHLGGKAVEATLTIDGGKEKKISDKLIGVFFEDISHAADGGLYAELVQNRDFEYSAKDRRGWTASTAWRTSNGTMQIEDAMPLSKNNPHYAVLTNDTVWNTGWDGIAVSKGETYDFSIFANNIDGKSKALTVALVDGNRVLATANLKTKGKKGQWTRYSLTLSPTETAAKAELRLTARNGNRVGIDMVSLFPRNTFKGRKNGLRRDLAQKIADLHPKFVRFPGGCMSHGDGIDNIYHWQHTVGALEDRVPDRNIWNYHQTRGLGFYEYFQFCEDINAEPLPVLAAGVPCQNSGPDAKGYGGQQGGIDMKEMPAYIQELFDLIEWANGDPATSKWAKMRAEAGHPAPFNLKYIGIGNEDIISTAFEDRCKMICSAIKERYPYIIICGTVGPFHAPSADYIEGWKFANANKDILDMVDEHYYESVGWFLNNQHYYDNYDRNAPKVYLGEYAARQGKGSIDCALAEAAYLCGIERNADVVEMTSYAPLLSKNGHSNWSPDMIYFDNTAIQTAPSYETQRLFSTYGGDRYVESTLAVGDSTATNRVAASVVRDSKTGKRYLKVVNILPVNLNLTIGARSLPLSNTLRYEGFDGKPGQAKVGCTTGNYEVRQDDKLTVTLPPYSFRAIEL